MKLFDTLNASGARYVVVGGLASLLHGVGRTTVDVDIALDFATDSATAAIDALTTGGYRPAVPVDVHELANAETRNRWQRDNSMVVFSLWDSGNRQPTLDILLDPVVPFPQLLRDAVSMDLQGTKVPVVSISHLIQLKQHSGRAQDIADIEALRRVQQHKSGS